MARYKVSYWLDNQFIDTQMELGNGGYFQVKHILEAQFGRDHVRLQDVRPIEEPRRPPPVISSVPQATRTHAGYSAPNSTGNSGGGVGFWLLAALVGTGYYFFTHKEPPRPVAAAVKEKQALRKPSVNQGKSNASAGYDGKMPATRPVKLDPKHPLRVGEEFYPDAAKRANQEGRCIVGVSVLADGRLENESIEHSTGFAALDDACLKGVHGQRMLPALENGVPVEKKISIPIVWKISGK